MYEWIANIFLLNFNYFHYLSDIVKIAKTISLLVGDNSHNAKTAMARSKSFSSVAYCDIVPAFRGRLKHHLF
jgi:hypothetical protein